MKKDDNHERLLLLIQNDENLRYNAHEVKIRRINIINKKFMLMKDIKKKIIINRFIK